MIAVAAAALALAFEGVTATLAVAEETVPGIETRPYFGLVSTTGANVTDRDFAHFLADEVTPRFPDGLTVIPVHGQSAGRPVLTRLVEGTMLLILVHPDGADAVQRVATIKANYRERFPGTAIFHTRSQVEIVLSDAR